MAELKKIQTTTTLNVFGNLIEIFTQYDADELPNILAAIISDSVGTDNGTNFIENELLVQMKNYPSEIDVVLNDKGELIIIAPDASQYSIDSNGELIYTTP